METAFRWLYRRLGHRYLIAFLAFELVSALTICVATVGLLSIYEPLDGAEFGRILAVAAGCTVVAIAVGSLKIRRNAAELLAWMRPGRRGADPAAAWRNAVSLPYEFVSRETWQPIVLVAVPVATYTTVELELPALSWLIVFGGALVAIAYSAILHFFGAEMALRPVVRSIADGLPDGFDGQASGIPLRWKLLGALPLINVITGVTASGLSQDGRASLNDLGLDVLVAVLVAFTLSFELTLLVSRSVLVPVRDLLAATDRVKNGDLTVRVPVASGDEMGQLAMGFNEMMTGLQERERLRDAFGSYVDRDVAARVLEEGELLEGEDVEVTVVFVDICDFTAYAERSSARDTVGFLNDFFGLAVPILTEHGGFVNKFLGDGMLAVFGAPVRLPDHAARAVAAARELADAVERRYGRDLKIGVGINSGRVSAGSVGGGGRLEFTVVGDAVNTAARVEQATREMGETILLTEATRALLPGAERLVEPRGEVELRGKSEPVAVYSPVPERVRDAAPAPG